jgi:hypothetical protein
VTARERGSEGGEGGREREREGEREGDRGRHVVRNVSRLSGGDTDMTSNVLLAEVQYHSTTPSSKKICEDNL